MHELLLKTVFINVDERELYKCNINIYNYINIYVITIINSESKIYKREIQMTNVN